MGERIRNFDWSKTPIGTIESWPQCLLTTVSIMVHSKFPMFLFWGEHHIGLYNDAFRASLGTSGKHPSALGMPGIEIWPEIWPTIYPDIEQVMAGNEATWNENQLIPIYRNGQLEDVYWTYSYSPVYNEQSLVEGVLVVVTETTQAVETLRKLEEQTNQLSFAIEAADMVTWDLDPASGALAVSDKFRDWFGLPDGPVTLEDAFSAIVPQDIGRVRASVAKALESATETRFEERCTTVNPVTGFRREILSKGHIHRDADGKAFRMNGVVQDVSFQANAIREIEESEHLLRNLIQESPVRISFIEGPDFRVRLANEIVVKSWGKGDDVFGRPLGEILPEIENQPFMAILKQVYETGIPYAAAETEVHFFVDGKPMSHYVDLWYKPITDTGGKVYGILATSMDVTDKVETRKRMADSETRFRNVVESAPFPIGVYTGPDLTIRLANQVMIDVWGKGPDVIGKSYMDVLPELKDTGIYRQILDVMATGIPYHAKNTRVDLVVDDRLQPFYFNYSFTPVYDASGAIYGVMNTAADVTDVNLANKKAEQSEANLRNTILQAPVAMCLLKGKSQFVEIANDRMLELWGKKHEEIVGRSLMEGLREIEGQGFDLLLDHVYTSGETYRAFDVPVSLPRGSGMETVYVDFVYEAFREDSGDISGVMVVASDVTEQVVARRKIEQAEESARLAIASADLGTYEINLLTHHIYGSPRLSEIYGFDESVPYEQYVDRIHPDDLPIREKAFEEGVKMGSLHYEIRLIWEDGSQHWIRTKGTFVYDDEGEAISLLGIVQDITEQKKFAEELQKQVRERTAELHRSNDDLLHFAHVASHDLKEPVRKIKVFSNLLAEEYGKSLPERAGNYLGKIQTATDRMFMMIDGVLSYSTLNAGEQPIEKIDLNDVISNIESDLEVLIQRKGATLLRDRLPSIQGASVLIYQLFYNLVNNALKFSKPDVPPRILFHSTIINRNHADMAEITISDNGIGIEQQYAEQIFNAFARLHAKDQYEGTGLGLALCKKIVERHRGSISATGIKGEGATFTVMLPIRQTQKII
jgi:PAS domain S-box-containing protein